MDSQSADLRLQLAAKVAALVDAIRSIPPELSPVARARTQAVREQIYHGYERPLAKERGGNRVWGTYEKDRHWSVAAARAFRAGLALKGKGELNRDHVWGAASIVQELLALPRSPAETADLLDERLVTCTVLKEEHDKLARVSNSFVGWKRYEEAGITVQDVLDPLSEEAAIAHPRPKAAQATRVTAKR